jgi:hypothetical protein
MGEINMEEKVDPLSARPPRRMSGHGGRSCFGGKGPRSAFAHNFRSPIAQPLLVLLWIPTQDSLIRGVCGVYVAKQVAAATTQNENGGATIGPRRSFRSVGYTSVIVGAS